MSTHKYEECYHYDYKSKEWGDFKIVNQLGLRGKTKVPYYLIRFKDTGNENEVPEHTIDRREVKDIIQQKKLTDKRRKEDKKEKQEAQKRKSTHAAVYNDEIRLISLDLATYASGWAVFKNEKLINYGVISSNKTRMDNRIREIQSEICKIMNKYDINSAAIEDPPIMNRKTLKYLALQNGVARDYFVLNDIPYAVMDVNNWKSELDINKGTNYFGGNSRITSKEKTIQRVDDIYGLDLKKEIKGLSHNNELLAYDAADAIGIGYVAIKNNIHKK